jgi:hypothetical protein
MVQVPALQAGTMMMLVMMLQVMVMVMMFS